MAVTVTSPRGAEISERSTDFVLPDDSEPRSEQTAGASRSAAAPSERKPERKFRVSESDMTTASLARGLEPDPHTPETKPATGEASIAAGLTNADAPTDSILETQRNASKARAATGTTGNGAPAETPAGTAEQQAAAAGRGVALPGDRGPRSGAAEGQRPSFWRRIALGRRATPVSPRSDAAPQKPAPAATPPQATTTEVVNPERPTLAERAINAVAPAPAREPVDLAALEGVIVEPMLQALVSVEAKLERSHVELVGRSDQVEQRLTQLWDIEEQLGTLSELQESLLQVTEQQRRLETAVVSQTRTLRWLVGAVFFSLAVAAFVVAAVLR